MDGNKRTVVPARFLFALGQLFFDHTLAESLEIEVERRCYLQAAAADDAVAGNVFWGLEQTSGAHLGHLVLDEEHEVGRLHVELGTDVVQWLGLRRVELLRLDAHDLLDLAGVVAHQVEYLELTRLCPVPIFDDRGAVFARRLRQAGQQRGLRQGQVFGALAEIHAGGRLGAVRRMAVVNLVEVPLEDLAVAVASFEL